MTSSIGQSPINRLVRLINRWSYRVYKVALSQALSCCTHWVMVCFVVNHYTARASSILVISIRGLGMHYVFDHWMSRHYPNNPICRYADDGLAHCRSEKEAVLLKAALGKRLKECGLEMHPTKTKIVYCQDDLRKGKHSTTSFDFLGYTFRPRRSKNRYGKHFINFTPAMSRQAGKAIRQEVRRWNIPVRSDKSIFDLAN